MKHNVKLFKTELSKIIFLFQFILPYSVSKTALLGLTKALSSELGPENIRVNCVAPGIIDTKFAAAVSVKGLRLGRPNVCSLFGHFQ